MCDVVKVFVIPGGSMPERKSAGAEGYDVAVRAIVAREMDPKFQERRKTLWDLTLLGDYFQRFGLTPVIGEDKQGFFFKMSPGERLLFGLGFVLDLGSDVDPESNWSYEVVSRTSTADQCLCNWSAGIPVDADFRAEAIADLQLSPHFPKPFLMIRPGQRLVQITFRGPRGRRFPNLIPVSSFEELSPTNRRNRCHGSTGA